MTALMEAGNAASLDFGGQGPDQGCIRTDTGTEGSHCPNTAGSVMLTGATVQRADRAMTTASLVTKARGSEHTECGQ